jgi:LacI family transcriptional regulator
MTATIWDVARRLNLSITTVSRALDGYDDVAEETRRLIVFTAQEMGYVPNQAARQLRRQRTDTLGYILPSDTPRFSDPFFAEFIAGLADEASVHNFDLLVSIAPPDSDTEKSLYQRWIHGRRVDGLILNRVRLEDWRVEYMHQSGFPFVSFGRSYHDMDYQAVQVDDRLWFNKLMQHLLSLGHKRIAFIGAPSKLRIQADRFAGYQDGLSEAGLSLDASLVMEGDLTAEGGFRAAEKLLSQKDPPSAITCVDDLTAMGVLHAARENGVMVGRDLAVTGFDGIVGFEHTQPPLTTVNQPIYQIARRLVLILAGQIRGENLENDQVKIEPKLEIRESTIGKDKR